MPDLNQFIDAIGDDITTAVVPRVEELAQTIEAKIVSDHLPRASALVDQLVRDIVAEQSAIVSTFVRALVKDVIQRYRPELVGEIQTTIVADGILLTGQGVRLELSRRDTGVPVTSLDIPISIRINVPNLDVNLDRATVRLDVLR